MNLVIVESPAKAKTLKKFLGSNYKIESSIGHIIDLPKSQLGVDFDNDFEPKYITIRGKGTILAKLKKQAKIAEKVYLATDPDREGEAISWHLKNALSVDSGKIFRITFNQITKDAVKNAIKNARDIDMKLVNAQQARRVLDRVVGYKISPLLWKKLKKKGLSAGRVQSVALKLICDREEDVLNFIPQEYWSIDVDLKTSKNAELNAKLFAVVKDNKEVKLDQKAIKNEEEALSIESGLKGKDFTVKDIVLSKRSRKPHPPFTTSTLQQEASKNLNFASNKTMMLAQQLYEGVTLKERGLTGLLTYIRTDSTRIAPEAFEEIKTLIQEKYGDKYTPKAMRVYKTKSRVQDAHEAIRPAYPDLMPADVAYCLTKDQYRLYTLVWNRFTASQMPDAQYASTTVNISGGNYVFRATATTKTFDGFTILQPQKDEEENTLPPLEKGDKLSLIKINKNKHFTQPPARYTDASLVKTLEEMGIGRPSTYASIIGTLTNRNYVNKENKAFFPTELGGVINDILKDNFENIVDVDFTAKMETDLDKVEEGQTNWKEILRNFYPDFEKKIQLAEENIQERTVEDQKTDIQCEKCGAFMVIKYGRFGKFLACPAFPECRNAKPFFEDAGVNCPLCKHKVLIKKSKKGRLYYGCENGDCSFISWNKPIDKPCPDCGAFLVEKGGKKVKVLCSNEECGYIE